MADGVEDPCDEISEKTNSKSTVIEDRLDSVIEPLKTPATTNASEESEIENLDDEDGNDNISFISNRSSRSRRSLLEDEELSDIIGDEREDGDGEEESSSTKDKKLDDDEDRRNPQYIPKRGTFYEHDDRTTMEEGGSEGEPKENSTSVDDEEEKPKETKPVIKKGKVWTEKADKWSHDLYIEDDQKPKSTQELIDTYGYDIRNEDAPPKARRRRRYGRGPNKYTRNWEDEEAYGRPTAPNVPRKAFQNNREEFPDINERKPRSKSWDRKKGRTSEKITTQNPVNNSSKPNHHENMKSIDRVEKEQRNGVARDARKDDSLKLQLGANAFVAKGPYVESNIPAARGGLGRGFRGKSSGSRPTMEFTSNRGRGRKMGPPFEEIPNTQGDSLKQAGEALSTEFSHLFISNGTDSTTNGNINIPPDVPSRGRMPIAPSEIPPRMQENLTASSSNRSKRYSTQRQRSLPETAQPPPYTMGYYGPSPQIDAYPPGPVYNEGVPVAPPPVTSPPMQMVTFLPPGPPPPPGTTPPYPPPPIINYVTPPTYALPIPPPNAAAEIFQGQGGITYYNAQSQAVVPRQTPPRRVKLAIPIVPPPEKSTRGRGRSDPTSPSGQSQHEMNTAVS